MEWRLQFDFQNSLLFHLNNSGAPVIPISSDAIKNELQKIIIYING